MSLASVASYEPEAPVGESLKDAATFSSYQDFGAYPKRLVLRINGVDLSAAIDRISVDSDGPECLVEIELASHLRSTSGQAQRHLKGLSKAKN